MLTVKTTDTGRVIVSDPNGVDLPVKNISIQADYQNPYPVAVVELCTVSLGLDVGAIEIVNIHEINQKLKHMGYMMVKMQELSDVPLSPKK